MENWGKRLNPSSPAAERTAGLAPGAARAVGPCGFVAGSSGGGVLGTCAEARMRWKRPSSLMSFTPICLACKRGKAKKVAGARVTHPSALLACKSQEVLWGWGHKPRCCLRGVKPWVASSMSLWKSCTAFVLQKSFMLPSHRYSQATAEFLCSFELPFCKQTCRNFNVVQATTQLPVFYKISCGPVALPI